MVIILAPHLEYPTHNGGDIYVDRLACHLSAHRSQVLVLGSNTLTTYQNGILANQQPLQIGCARKSGGNSHTGIEESYLVEKYLTAHIGRSPNNLLQKSRCDGVLQCISSANLDVAGTTTFVLTQNDEIAFYEKQYESPGSIAQGGVASRTKAWTTNFLKNSGHKHILCTSPRTDHTLRVI